MQQTIISADADTLIKFSKYKVGSDFQPILSDLSWTMSKGECWLVTGPNGGGKSAFAKALAGDLPVYTETSEELPGPRLFPGPALLVSLENAAAVIEREQENDESDFTEGGIDPGTSAHDFLKKSLSQDYPADYELRRDETVRLCGVFPYLDRGLKRLSTGEIRRLLLCQALLVRPALLVLDEPYEGLDAASRPIVADIISRLAEATVSGLGETRLVLVTDRFEMVPQAVNQVVEFRERRIFYAGPRTEFEKLLASEKAEREAALSAELPSVLEGISEAAAEADALGRSGEVSERKSLLVEMNGIAVGWSGKLVLDAFSWKVRAGEHWLIRGPNGSGKTTLLELITGDNPQVYCNDVRIFGRRRGTGESIWDIKAKLGIVSYRLHLQYRAMSGLGLEEVLISGLHDSIGLYQKAGDTERVLARRWLKLCGMTEAAGKTFGTLSYGEQRALLIARAAIKGPPLLILDEPCHGLDEDHRERILGLLEIIADRGISTLLHVTHDPSEVLPCERRILELRPDEKPMWKIIESCRTPNSSIRLPD